MKLFALLVFAFSLPVFAQTKLASLFEAPPAAPETKLSCSELFSWMDEKKPSSVEETLKLITERRPKFLTHATFAYGSRSLQSSTYENPRAIVFSGDAETILSFNGEPGQRGYERLEMICFNEPEKTFEFHDIAFPKEANSTDELEDLTASEQAQNFAHTNGRSNRDCRMCHQTPARPNWDAYPFWPGFYGAVDDSNNYTERAKMFPFYPTYTQFESKKWHDFYDNRAGRYQYVSQQPGRVNLQFGQLLEYLNGKRIVGDLKRLGEKFEPKKYQFANALFCSKQGTTYTGKYPDGKEALRTVIEQTADDVTKSIFLSIATSHAPKLNRISKLLTREGLDGTITNPNTYDSPSIPYYLQIYPNVDFSTAALTFVKDAYMLAAFKAIVEPLGVSIENWGLQLLGGYMQNYGLGHGDDNLRLALVHPFTEEFLYDDPQLAEQIQNLEKKETDAYNSRDPKDAQAAADLKAAICLLIKTKLN